MLSLFKRLFPLKSGKRAFLLCGWLCLLTLCAQAGILKGKVTDEKGAGLAFATVYLQGSTVGSTTNEQGNYQFSVEPGQHTVVFQYVGYKTQTKTIDVPDEEKPTPLVLNAQLLPDVYNLNEVRVSLSGKNPAYGIMEQVIARRDYHLKEVQAYTAQVYVKGLQRLINVPKRVLGIMKVPAGLKPGILYLSESVSELNFMQPGKYRERMISSKVSGNSRAFSFNQASEFNVNFYQNLVKAKGVNERGFVSPLANNAMFFYKYELMGSSQNNGHLIHRIKVIPKRKSDPVVTGYLYIVDGSWRLQSLNLYVTKDQQIEFVDTLRITQQFTPAAGNVWVLQSQKFTFDVEGYGFKGNGYFTAVYSKYRVKPASFVKQAPVPTPVAPEIAAPAVSPPIVAAQPKAKPTRKERRAQRDAPPTNGVPDAEYFKKKEVLLIEQEANTRDSAYWAEMRPVPLTEEEVVDYHTKDSLQVIKESKPYKDSLDRKNNKFSVTGLLLSGYSYRNTFERTRFSIEPITRIWQYNTVEGLVANLRVGYTKQFEDRRSFYIAPTLRYGFSNEKAQAKLQGTYTYDLLKRRAVGFEGGRFVSQFNAAEPITPFVNTVYTLLFKENYEKLYQRNYLRLWHNRELVNGLAATFMVDYAQREMLFNTTDFVLRDRDSRVFTPNEPQNAEVASTAFPRHQALTAALSLSYRPGAEYISHPDRKINLGSKWPTFNLNYRKGIANVLGSDVNYDFVSLGVSDELQLGLVGTSDYSVSVGTFWRKKQLYFMDFRHFSGNRTILSGDFSGFQLLDYYRYSTQKTYIEAHYSHHFNGFILNKIPLIRKLKWQEVGSLNYLHTDAAGHYLEVGVGLEHLFKVFRVDFVTGFQERQKVSSGIRIGYGF
ncbi:carboxypeptidase-like regulatory domain-containing protein [Rufibacter sp. H-1]|uniref:Carboxypeptidase-like regulatory domain-containing protein n=2 Tax=Rufibacter sediminis TaxID=2762756 RepID=A0ABR6VUA9_9BACT|nr:carboxypeptidase-like regulatory domain-containing protein [Rufibacter sediminis]